MTRSSMRRPGPSPWAGHLPAGLLTIGTVVLAASLAAAPASGQMLTVRHLAGTLGGGGSADGTGSAARFLGPAAVAANAAGTVLFVADGTNHTIRRVDATTGAVTTLAGRAGVPGSADGIGSAARFNYPSGIAADATGALVYVADTSNHTIRQITVATGAVITLAGSAGHYGSADGVGSSARFYNPRGVAVDAAGTVMFVGDTTGRTIRRIDLGTATVTTLAGLAFTPGSVDGVGSAARFGGPYGVTTDAGGTVVFVTEREANTVRRIEVATQTVTTLAGLAGNEGQVDGTGTAARFRRPTSVATDSTGAIVYVGDSYNHAIRRLDPTTRGVTTFVGWLGTPGSTDGTGTSARFKVATGVTADASGTTLYVADTSNNTIRRVDVATAAVTTLAGLAAVPGGSNGVGGTARFDVPSGAVADPTGTYAFVTDANNAVRRIELATGTVTTLAGKPGACEGGADGVGTAAQFCYPEKLAINGAGTVLFVADGGNSTIRRIEVATGAVTTLAGLAGEYGSDDGVGSAARFSYPIGIAVDAAGTTLYVADLENDTIRRIDVATGTVSTLAGLAGVPGSDDGTGTAARFDWPFGVATDAAGTTVFVADYNNHTIRRVDPATGVVSTIAGTAETPGVSDGTGTAALFDSPGGIVVDVAGATAYVLDSGNDTIRRVALGTGVVTTVAGIARRSGAVDGIGKVARFNFPTGIGTTPDGRTLVVADTSNHAIRIARPVGGSAGDYDSDGVTDVAVYRPSSGTWFSLDSSSENAAYRFRGWGVQASGDVPVPGDYDGDGVIDPTVYRPSTGSWFILESHANYTTWNWFGWGAAGDTLMPGDYDGDGKTDAAVYRPTTGVWYVRPSGGAATWSVTFGQAGDTPIRGDFDGDGKADIAVYRPSTGSWFVLTSSSSFNTWWFRGWGIQAQGDTPVPIDYDGDGKTDPCVFRPGPGTWFVLESHANYTTWTWFGWGNVTDTLMAGDYDGDGRTDATIYRSSTGVWYVRPSSGAATWNVTFGQTGDVPLSSIR